MHDGNAARYVGVGIAFAGNAMRSPAGVGDAGDRLGACRGGFQLGYATDRADALDAILPNNCQAG
ncbi:hypothetical protein SDC9_212450 [bioreactor metagenome]|uniref:Uncharacterized protein n=1 Tax=bioreactor metagenome TaxID=1076179 RepID=A0A645JZ09_9ZZZZ